METKQVGFTLIELVMVIVILGILAAVAVPKFVDLSSQADDAAVKGVAGALASAAAVNYAAKVANNTNAVTVNSCTTVTSAIQSMPSGYTVTDSTTFASGATRLCTVTGGSSKTANFVAVGA